MNVSLIVSCLSVLYRINSLHSNDVHYTFATSFSPILCCLSYTQHRHRTSAVMVVNEKLLQQRHVIPYHGRQIELCGGFYDGHKPVVGPLARPVLCSQITPRLVKQNSSTVGGISQGSITFVMVRARWECISTSALTECCLQAHDWTF